MLFVKRYLFVFFITFVLKTQAQDALFTSNQQSLLYLNPSFAGSNGFMRYQSLYRNQWPNLSSQFVTYYSSFDAYLKPLKAGVGLSVSADDQERGTLQNKRIDLTYAQHFELLDKKLKIVPSFQVSYLEENLDRTKLNFGDQINARYGIYWTQNSSTQFPSGPNQKKVNVDFSTGLLINYKHFYFGSTVFHSNQPDIGLMGSFKLPYRLSMFTSYNMFIGEKNLLNFLVRIENQQQFTYSQISINALLIKHLIIGFGFKTSNSLNAAIGYRNNFFAITGVYDYDKSKLSGSNAGSYELTASFNLRPKEQRKTLTDFEKW